MSLLTSEALEIKFNKYQGKDIKRHPILPLRKFEKGEREIDITNDVLEAMAANLKIRRPITIAHPDLDSAEAVGWMVPGTAEVSAFGDSKALYVGVEWSEQAKEAIESRKYGYISPVFSMDTKNETGDDIGPALLAAGLTNNPHWSEDQPELWAQFTSYIDKNNDPGMFDPLDDTLMKTKADPASDADPINPEKEKEEMEKLEQAEARIQELEASIAELTAESEKLAAAKADADKQIEQFTAEAENRNDLEAQVKKLQGEALLKKYESKLRPKHLEVDGKPSWLHELAFSDPDQFERSVSLIDEPESDNSVAAGSDNTEPAVQLTAREQAHKFASEEADKVDAKLAAHVFKTSFEAKLKELEG